MAFFRPVCLSLGLLFCITASAAPVSSADVNAWVVATGKVVARSNGALKPASITNPSKAIDAYLPFVKKYESVLYPYGYDANSWEQTGRRIVQAYLALHGRGAADAAPPGALDAVKQNRDGLARLLGAR